MHRYLVVFEKTDTGYSAFVPDLPGCIATGLDRKTTESSIYEAIELHIEGLRMERVKIPPGRAEGEVLVFKSTGQKL